MGRLVHVAAPDPDPSPDLRVSLEYVRDDGCLRREPLAECAVERFETPAQPSARHPMRDTAGMPG